jgi:hypothetical protein
MNLPSATFDAKLTVTARLAGGSAALTVADVLADTFLMWGLESPCVVAEHYRYRAINDLNRAMQILWNRAKDRKYWTQSTLEIVFPAETGVVELENEIQNVVGQAAIASTGQPLVPVGSMSEIEQFESLFLDSSQPASPVAYHIERVNQSGNDPSRCRFHVVPIPASETTVVLDVVFESPRYTWDDYVNRTMIPIPHRYAESLLLPVLRFHASNFWLFNGPAETRQMIAAEYAEVARQLGMADPLPGLSGDNRKDREEAVA